MQAIWKFPLAFGLNQVALPTGAQIRHVGAQLNGICLWAEINTDELKREERLFSVYATGDEHSTFKENYVGTVLLMEGALVFHVYETLRG